MKIHVFPLIRGLIISVIVIVVALNVAFALQSNEDHVFTSNYWARYEGLKKMYYDSIYANKKGTFIRDEYIYSFAAGSLIKGVSPILVNPETPPLGKYFIALSILIFNNEHVIVVLFGIASLLLLYFIGKQIFSSALLALLPVLLLSFEPLFINQFAITPLLDIIQLFFLLAFFLLFNKAEVKRNFIIYFLAANVMVGSFISVKFFGTGITLVGAATFVLLFRREFRKVSIYLITTIIAPIVLLLMYIPVLFTGYPLKDFLGIQKWIFLYNAGHLSKMFTFFPLFLFNKWYSWWDNSILSDFQWRITWPISFVTFVLTLVGYPKFIKNRNKDLDIVLAWSFLYILLMQTGYVSARYFVILLPPMFLIMVNYFWTFFIFLKTENKLKFFRSRLRLKRFKF